MKDLKLSKNEMKKILGGLTFGDSGTIQVTSCSTTCSNGQKIEIIECDGDCLAYETFVTCVKDGKTIKTVNCSGSNSIAISSVDRSVLLISSASPMLAQANTAPQSILSLLN